MVAIITGASKGIGKACALRFAQGGYDLAMCARGLEELTTLKDKIGQLYPSCKVYIQSVDVSQEEAVIDFGHRVLHEFPKVDILINNAGIFTPGNIMDESHGTLQLMIETNLYSAYHLTRVIAPMMKSHKKGHIINLCSVASLMALPNGGSYSISKFALLGFSKVLREELKDTGVKVTSILPGATWSASWAGVELPEDRLMPASDIADVIWNCTQLSHVAVVEEILIRPQLGDL